MRTRRQFLAIAGAVAVAGCGDEGGAADGTPTQQARGDPDETPTQDADEAANVTPTGDDSGGGTTDGDTPTGDGSDGEDTPEDGPSEGDALEFSSGAFDDGGTIPTRYTADGEDVSPPLAIEAVPEGTEALALIVDDPDAPNGEFVHWLLWNVPADTGEVPEGIPQAETVDRLDGAAQGTNDFGEIGYRGPAPPEDDDAHTYQFELYALESPLDLDPGAERSALTDAMGDLIVADSTISAEYARQTDGQL